MPTRDYSFVGRLVLICALFVAFAIGTNASDDLTLAAKARVFDADLVERFLDQGQVRVRRWLPTRERPFVHHNMSDTAYMTGIYCATQTWRYLATGDPEAADLARAAAVALGHLVTVTGSPGLLARASVRQGIPWFDDGVWHVSADGQHRWRGGVSSDQVDGLIFGLFVFATELADPAEREAVGRTIGSVVDAIIANGYHIVGYDGEPTNWGHYEFDYGTREEPMNALLLLQMVKVAHALTGEARYETEYRRLLDRGYARTGEGARLDDPPLEANHSDDVLIALALYPLLALERDPVIRASYLRAAERWYRGGIHPGIDVEANPFATFLYQHWTGERAGHAGALNTLREVPLDMKWNPDTIAAYVERFGFTFQAEPLTPYPGEVLLPVGQRGRTWSFLVHNPYRVGGDRLVPAPFETNGLDFLLSYWFGRANDLVGARE